LVKHQADYDGKLAQVVEIVGAKSGVEDRAKQKRCRGLSRVCLIDAEIALPQSATKKKRPAPGEDSEEGEKKKAAKKK
jgi:hypothetical protein